MSGGIEIDSQAIWCAKHRRVLALDPKRRFDMACQRLFDFAVRDQRIQAACGYNPMTGTRADVAKLTEVIRAFSPLCCFIPQAKMERVLRESYPGVFQEAQREMLVVEQVAQRVAGGPHRGF